MYLGDCRGCIEAVTHLVAWLRERDRRAAIGLAHYAHAQSWIDAREYFCVLGFARELDEESEPAPVDFTRFIY